MNHYQIKEGDIVSIRWEYLEPVGGTVMYVPVASGDCWHILDRLTGQLHYVQSFARMTLIK